MYMWFFIYFYTEVSFLAVIFFFSKVAEQAVEFVQVFVNFEGFLWQVHFLLALCVHVL